MKKKTFIATAVALFSVSATSMAQMTYEDAVSSSASYYNAIDAASVPTETESLTPEELQEVSATELIVDTLYLKSNGAEVGGGLSIPLSGNIADYKELHLTYRLNSEDVGVHTRTMTVSTNLWHTDSTHTKSSALYRYSETAGVDKDRWSTIHFWRTGTKSLWAGLSCDRYCSGIQVVAVEGIK